MTDAPRRPGSSLSLKARALKYLAGRELSRDGLRRKLWPHAQAAGETQEALDHLLDELQARGFLSNQRFAESLVHRKAPALGVRRVREELTREGVERSLVDQAVAALQGSEFERAQQLWQRRYGELTGDERERARQTRFLLARGFSAEVVQRIVRGRAEKA